MAINNVAVSDTIMEAMRREAQASGQDVNSLFEQAAERLLANRELDDLAAYGRTNARRLGIKPSDVVRLVREDRNQQSRVR